MDKRGIELSSTQISMIVLTLLAFIVVVLFITGLPLGGLAGQETCHLSVLTRGTAPEAATSYVPLKCQTERICLQDKAGNNCKYSFAGESMTKPLVLDEKNDSIAAKQIDSISADAMYRCWTMMGEGKLNLMSNIEQKTGITYAGKPMCVICSRISVDVPNARRDSIYSKEDLGAYLQNNPVSSDSARSYLEYFTDDQVSAYPRVPKKDATDISVSGSNNYAGNDVESAVVFMQIKPVSYKDAFSTIGNIAVGGAGGAFVMSPKWTVKGIVGVTKHPVISLILGAVGAGYVSWNVYEGQSAAAVYCGERTSPSGVNEGITDAKKGCSLVQVVPYNAAAINSICGYIESTDGATSGGLFS